MKTVKRQPAAVGKAGRDARPQRISVIGLGYIGLPTAAVFASRGIEVIGVDTNAGAVETINQGRIHIVEPDLDMVVQAATFQGKLRATLVPEPADAFLIAVPTPFKDEHEPDLSHIQAVAKAIAPVLKAGNLVVLESTSPVGATEKLADWLAAARTDLTFPQQAGEASDIRIAYCPERVLPGHILRELVANDRVIGGMTPRCSEAAAALYRTFVSGECVISDARTAEMCKLTENAFRDVNIAFANELSLICDKLGVSVWELIALANRHPRVNILQPGAGVGGHCIAVDPWFIVSQTPDEARLIHTARQVNDHKPHWVTGKVMAAVNEVAVEKGIKAGEVKVAAFGLTFKPNIDDMRQSPALEIVGNLAPFFPHGIWAVDPYIDELPADLAAKGVTLVPMAQAYDTADVLVLLVDHRQFIENQPERRAGTRTIDTRGIWRS
ncbi:UDP-N-acetyl-D-mannosamine dehydrogenase [Novosphingobium olei]|uniref:UDP-N-acetyl-D-mannosamine dehydrogenase n=1 Tax=Novosphingobium olei TaxID=2728851 RepID=UPI0030855A6A|nr:UDP-N-acetyl-D-mannosamine dehydrogenase [Novosphingobium olei]